ncbi:type II toxin-antitoxin system VapC family toxin [Paeniglutamicibacter antarcticus]|uniref:Type II toxin-antitoxin system VapC family toxin n=1 Tax=Arthrobacter terrae TaxID=2935737 RepID=A0A931CT17_9MICC|nr:type II toxin-antitoxin system VapC family toxin [Arthrobacter terrae]MBG0739253.1 type II toxin-antitoxin system VapC family toxin [Arthrobacter terrae]
MIGLDTNVLVRYLVQDDPKQSQLASQLMSGFTSADPGYLSLIVLVETIWVLRRSYKLDPRDISRAILKLSSAEEILVESPEMVRRAARESAGGADFADALIVLSGRDSGCEYTATFDQRAAELDGMELLR